MADEQPTLKKVLTERARYPMLPKGTPELLDAIREFYGANDKYNVDLADDPKTGMPRIPQPSRFQPDVPVIGSPLFARTARYLMDTDPRGKAHLKRIIQGPTAASMREMQQSGLPREVFKGTNLAGIYAPFDREIGVQPGSSDWESTLIHELAHATGYPEDGARQAETIAAKAQKEGKRK